jgi:hypothetical protein
MESLIQGLLILSFYFDFELFCAFLVLPLFVPFLSFVVFFLLDVLLKLFVSFWSSSCASWGFRIEL